MRGVDMKVIKDFLTGKYPANDFMRQLMAEPALQEYVQSLIPQDAIADAEHEYWKKCILRSKLECYDFNVKEMLYSHCGDADSETDQLELFNTIRSLYLWKHPDQRCTTYYEDNLFFYLELERDCFGGPEVTHLVKEIARNTVHIKPKSARKKIANAQICELFHVQDNKRPRWVQGPMWPMGSTSPMQFISQARQKEFVAYTFLDVDSGAIKEIKQHF